MEIGYGEIQQRLKEQDFLFYFCYTTVGCCNNEVTEELMLFAIRDKIIAYNGRDHHIPTVSQWQYDKVVHKITKYTKSWEVSHLVDAPLKIVVNFDGVPKAYYGTANSFKNFRKLHKVVDAVRKGFTII